MSMDRHFRHEWRLAREDLGRQATNWVDTAMQSRLLRLRPVTTVGRMPRWVMGLRRVVLGRRRRRRRLTLVNCCVAVVGMWPIWHVKAPFLLIGVRGSFQVLYAGTDVYFAEVCTTTTTDQRYTPQVHDTTSLQGLVVFLLCLAVTLSADVARTGCTRLEQQSGNILFDPYKAVYSNSCTVQ